MIAERSRSKMETILQKMSVTNSSVYEYFPLGKKALGVRAIIKMSGHQHWWLAGGYDLEIGHI